MDTTTRHALPFLVPGQAQKEWFHNEALQIADMLICPVAEGAPSTTPPVSPVAGNSYLVGAGATGAWAGKDHALACWTDNGWRFASLPVGSRVADKASDYMLMRTTGGWDSGGLNAPSLSVGGTKVVGSREAAIADAGGGSVIDVQARAAINALLAAARAHGLIAP